MVVEGRHKQTKLRNIFGCVMIKIEGCPCQRSVDYQFVRTQVQVDVLFQQEYHWGIMYKSHSEIIGDLVTYLVPHGILIQVSSYRTFVLPYILLLVLKPRQEGFHDSLGI